MSAATVVNGVPVEVAEQYAAEATVASNRVLYRDARTVLTAAS
jgi:hypothetical protein